MGTNVESMTIDGRHGQWKGSGYRGPVRIWKVTSTYDLLWELRVLGWGRNRRGFGEEFYWLRS